MPNLTEFLLARIAEDETNDLLYAHTSACASSKFPDPNSWDPGECNCGADTLRSAECEAKRRIVNRARGWIDEPDVTATSIVANDLLWHVLACLTLPYADHPDYDEAWRL